MAKSERKRTMVYSNVNKKADSRSAFHNNDIIDLNNEIIIGLDNFPKRNYPNKHKKNINYKKINNGQAKENLKKNIKSNNTSDIYTKGNQFNESKNNTITMKSQKTTNVKLSRKKIRTIRKMSVLLVLNICLIAGIIYFFLSPVFDVKAIEILNNNNITSEQIINSAGIKTNENTFKFSKKEAEKKILSNPYIENVNIDRKIFDNKVEINVQERIATLMLEYGNSYVYINNQGYILEISTVKLDAPILKGYVTPLDQIKPGNRLNKDDLGRLETVLSIIETANSNGLDNLITQIDISDTNNYIMILESEDKTVYLGNCSNLAAQMPYVKEMIEREKGREGELFVNMDLNNGRAVFREKV